jgi:ATP-dependent DNA helicase RecQ
MRRHGGGARRRLSRTPPANGGIDPELAFAGTDEAAFQHLRNVRKALADAESVPAYIVFNDKVLREMVARRPSTAAELLEVPGVGPAKLERYGDDFLTAIGELA